MRTQLRARLATIAAATILAAVSTAQAQRLNITNYSTDDGLAAAQVWSVFQDSRGYLWFGTSGGFSRYDGISFTNFTAGEGIPGELTRTIIEDQQGHLWFGTSNGVIRYDGRNLSHFDSDEGLGHGTVWASAKDSFGNLWFATQEGGVSVAKDGSFRTYTRADGLP